MLAFENQAWAAGYVSVAGIDEAGRGPLAGPVVAAAVVFPPDYLRRAYADELADLTDSKQLTAAQRDFFFDLLSARPEIHVSVGSAEAAEIDRINIRQATLGAMRQAVLGLTVAPDYALVDGRDVPPGLPCPAAAVIRGDARSLSVAAASVVAKVTRDRIMRAWDTSYPQYGFARHKGYGTVAHLRALREHGPCPIHRRTFAPVRQAIPPALCAARAHPTPETTGAAG